MSVLDSWSFSNSGRGVKLSVPPRIHGELLKLGFEVGQSSVAKYMVKRCGPPSQGWRTFLRNHAPDIAAMDLFVVPTIGFDLLYGRLAPLGYESRPAAPEGVGAFPRAEVEIWSRVIKQAGIGPEK